ncbi:hypothetical protein Sp245p_32740 (plasmid) [Azospirillum baldaniorum]|uniref:Uncharacterized protein n=1 Tax=Azospirillum baldaniorum TaxID=1064539 RepID=A0A9P1K1G1_9PROT|nr:hypothetical protein Sp245p_32740 [Azospirillum baldaniorum]CCD03812.1 protein of unknown function [Azospirillum baldaniorum]
MLLSSLYNSRIFLTLLSSRHFRLNKLALFSGKPILQIVYFGLFLLSLCALHCHIGYLDLRACVLVKKVVNYILPAHFTLLLCG